MFSNVKYVHTSCSTSISSFNCLQKMTLDTESLPYGSRSLEISFQQSLKYLCLSSFQSSSHSVSKMELTTYFQTWSSFLFQGASLSFFQMLRLQSLTLPLTFPWSSSGAKFCWAYFVFPFHCYLPTFRSCFSNQGRRILKGLHADTLGDLSVLHCKFQFLFMPRIIKHN